MALTWNEISKACKGGAGSFTVQLTEQVCKTGNDLVTLTLADGRVFKFAGLDATREIRLSPDDAVELQLCGYLLSLPKPTKAKAAKE